MLRKATLTNQEDLCNLNMQYSKPKRNIRTEVKEVVNSPEGETMHFPMPCSFLAALFHFFCLMSPGFCVYPYFQ